MVVVVQGLIPLQLQADSEDEQEKIEFRIPGKITDKDRFNRYAKYGTGIKTVTLPQYNGFSN